MSYLGLQVLKMLRIQHMGNTVKGIMWDYHVGYGDFIDCGGQSVRESQTGRV